MARHKKLLNLILHDERIPAFPRKVASMTLREALQAFSKEKSGPVLAFLLAVALVARVIIGDFGVWDIVLLGTVLTIHPFTEWMLHVFVLHARPIRLGRWVFDMDLAREHRDHHAAPSIRSHHSTPLVGALSGGALVALVAWAILPTWALWSTFLVVMFAIGLTFEWVHFLCHTTYRPRSRWFRARRRHHMRHHYKNEHYWMGVTMHMGDWVLGTAPDVHDVPTSPTCRTLGQDDQTATA